MKILSTNKEELVKIAKENADEASMLSARLKKQEQEQEQEQFNNELREGLRTAYVAYSDKEIAKEYLLAHDYKGDSFLALDSWVGTQGFCCIRKRRAYLAFRGTTFTLTDLIIDLAMWPWYKPRVHFGFGRSWKSVSKQVSGWLKQHASEFDSISLSGHSLGGAIAHVAAVHLAPDFPISNVVTMGSPRSSFGSSAQLYQNTSLKDNEKKLGQVTYRLVNGLDFVAKAPPGFLGYKHVGEMIYLSIEGQLTRGDEATKAKQGDKLFKKTWKTLANFFSPSENTMSYSSSTIKLPGQKQNISSRLIDFYKEYKEVFPISLIGPILYGIVFCLLPLIAFIMYSLFFLQSGFSHFKTNYIHYYFHKFESIDNELRTVRQKLGVKESPVIDKQTTAIISKMVFLGVYSFALYKIATLWVIPMLTSFLGGIELS